jgi:hypothetical protein
LISDYQPSQVRVKGSGFKVNNICDFFLRAGIWNVFFPIPQKLFPPRFDFADLEIANRSADY